MESALKSLERLREAGESGMLSNRDMASTTLSGGKVAHLGELVRELAAVLLGADRTRLVAVQPMVAGDVRWRVRIEAFIPNPMLTIAAQGGTKKILDCRQYDIDLNEAMQFCAMTPTDAV
jgi:hypothetical protein